MSIIKIIELNKPAKYEGGWSTGYPESEFESIKKLENGNLIENKEEIYLISSDGIKYGFKKEEYLIERTKEKALYHTPGNIKLWKYIQPNGTFEVIDRVGHYCKLFAEPIYNDFSFPEHKLYEIIFDEQQLSLLSNGFYQDFISSRFAEGVLIKEIGLALYSLLFPHVYSIQTNLNRMAQNGTLVRGGRTEEWFEISDLFNDAKEVRGIDINVLDSYSKYDYY